MFRRKKNLKYFVYYTFKGDGFSGDGMTSVTVSNGIETYDDILLVRDFVENSLKEKDGVSVSCIINNYKRIKD